MRAAIVIRTKNEEAWLARVLDTLARQVDVDAEVVIVDNDSTDATVEIARRHPCKVIGIPDREFTHGRALNLGIRATTAELVAILSGHCVPANGRWLLRLAANFTVPSIAGVYGRQEPFPDIRRSTSGTSGPPSGGIAGSSAVITSFTTPTR